MNTNDVTVVSNQYAGADTPTQTPLHHAQLNGSVGSLAAGENAGVLLAERELTGQLSLRIRGDLAAASTVIESALNIELPTTLKLTGNAASSQAISLGWVSPDEWRLLCPIGDTFEIEQKLRNALSSVSGLSHAIVKISQ